MRTECWLQIVPTFKRGEVSGARVERVTQSYPRDPLPAAVVLKATFDVPASTWAPLEAHGTIPEGAKIVSFTIELPEEDDAADPR